MEPSQEMIRLSRNDWNKVWLGLSIQKNAKITCFLIHMYTCKYDDNDSNY